MLISEQIISIEGRGQIQIGASPEAKDTTPYTIKEQIQTSHQRASARSSALDSVSLKMSVTSKKVTKRVLRTEKIRGFNCV